MQKRGGFFGIFLIFLFFCAFIILLGKTSFFSPITNFVQQIFAPISLFSYNLLNQADNFFYSSKLKSLEEENQKIFKKIVDQNKLLEDNKALRDQFATSYPRPQSLIPADIVGAPSFVPGFSNSETFIIDKGQEDGIRVGQAVVYKENLLGRVSKTSKFLSSVVLINNSNLSFVAKTLETNAQGVVKGQGGEDVILDEVLLSENLKIGDLVLTKGNIGLEGAGFPPDLIVGRITSVSKISSDLFQKAQVKSAVDFTKIDKVFVVIYP